jgi:hypothetical protein
MFPGPVSNARTSLARPVPGSSVTFAMPPMLTSARRTPRFEYSA